MLSVLIYLLPPQGFVPWSVFASTMSLQSTTGDEVVPEHVSQTRLWLRIFAQSTETATSVNSGVRTGVRCLRYRAVSHHVDFSLKTIQARGPSHGRRSERLGDPRRGSEPWLRDQNFGRRAALQGGGSAPEIAPEFGVREAVRRIVGFPAKGKQDDRGRVG